MGQMIYTIEVQRHIIEIVSIHIPADTPLDAMDKAVEVAREDKGEIIHREISGESDIVATVNIS